MKNLFFLSICFVCARLFGQSSDSQNTKTAADLYWETKPLLTQLTIAQKAGFTIKGKLVGLEPEACVSLLTVSKKAPITQEFDLTDTISTRSKHDGSFEFKGTPYRNGQLYALRVDGKHVNVLLLLSDGEDVSIKGKLSDWPRVAIKGSMATAEWYAYKKGFDNLQIQQKEKEAAEYRKQYLTNNPHSICASFIILKSSGLDFNEKKRYYANLTAVAKQSYWGKMTKNFLEDADRKENIYKTLTEGNIIPDFEVSNEKGEKTSIHQLIKQSKYTLIDFWATWCGPCVQAFPKLKYIYDNFHEKRFNIIGVSVDRDIANWRKVIRNENLQWTQVLDNIENASQKKFGNEGIPGYILVDQNRKIIYFKLVHLANGSFQVISSSSESSNVKEDISKILNQLLK